MKFFPPDFYLRFASDDDAVALEAHEEWERRVKRYRRHYKKIEGTLPLKMSQFQTEQCLHDADVFAPAVLPNTAPWEEGKVVIVAQQLNTLFPEYANTLAILHYTITSPPVVEVPLDSPVFKKVQPIWLYDEVDVVEAGVFSHEILISDGRVVKLLFSDFNYHIAPLCLPGKTGSPGTKKQRAASA